MRLLPWALMGIVGASIGLYTDNIGNMRDIARNSWRNDQQDDRLSRLENRQDRTDSAINDLINAQTEFHPQVIERLDHLLQKERRRRHQE